MSFNGTGQSERLRVDSNSFEPCRSSHIEMTAFYRQRKKALKKAKSKAEINRSALAGEPDPLERWLMALWVPLGLRKLGKDDFIFAHVRSSSIL